MAHNGVMAGGGRLTDWISLGVLASSVSRDAVDEAIMAAGKGARRSDGKLPPHVMVYRAGEYLDPALALRVRVIEYEVPDRDGDGELIALITTITDPAAASAAELADAYCQRWEEETGNDQLKTHLRGPGTVLRSKSPDMVRQEIHGYLLTHYAISALICRAATEASIDPDRVKFLRTVRIIRRRAADPVFPP